MQTFLPFPSFEESARVLDRQRLGKQRVEVLQILKALNAPAESKPGWANHPATKMWRGHERALCAYGVAICDEWIARGYQDTCKAKIMDMARHFPASACGRPEWLGREDFHAAHRAVLLAKDPDAYSKFGWEEEPAVPDSSGSYRETYIWPVS